MRPLIAHACVGARGVECYSWVGLPAPDCYDLMTTPGPGTLGPGPRGLELRGVASRRCAMTVTAQPVPILSDNYAWLLREDGSGAVAIVDPAEGPPIIAAIEAAGGR